MDEPKVTFAEIAAEIGPGWAEAIRVTANIQSPIEEKTRAEWEILVSIVKNKPTT